MSPAQIIEGKQVAEQVRTRVAEEVAALKRDHGITPGLTVVLVGENPASQVYVRNKSRQTEAAGMVSTMHRLPAETSQDELLALVDTLNHDPAVHGILVQLPLPGQIDETRVIEAIAPAKDVDGFHPENVGRVATGAGGIAPCTPLGCVILAKSAGRDLSGADAVVIGRSNIVGKPLVQLLLRENCTVTIAHSRTRDLPEVARRADILFAAVGRSEMVRGDWIKPGAVVIDVGINRLDPRPGEDKGRLVGDVAFDEAREVAGAITPVPGGVGPMTIACLLANTVNAARAQNGLAPVDLTV
jgi:methylenetetrahydrofolate dehydrogenase (NADP+) / methenyltetrahydrofolate cyclohydrolase